MKSLALIGTQLGTEAGGQFRRDTRLDFTGTPLDGQGLRFGQEAARGFFPGELQSVEALRFAGEIARAQAEVGELFFVLLVELKVQSTPTFPTKPDETAAGIEQHFDLLRSEGGIRRHPGPRAGRTSRCPLPRLPI